MPLTKVTYSMIDGDVINILDYGADPTGTVECSANIQAALDAANTRGGATVFLPKGLYKITSQLVIPKGTTFIGESEAIENTSSTVLLVGADVNAINLEQSFSRYGAYAENVKIKNVGIRYTVPSTSGMGIRIISSSYSTFQDLFIYGASRGIGYNRIQDCWFDGIIFSACTEGMAGITGAPSGDWMTMCRFTRIYAAGCDTGLRYDIPSTTSSWDAIASDANTTMGVDFRNLFLCSVKNVYTELNTAWSINVYLCNYSTFENIYIGVASNAATATYKGFRLTVCNTVTVKNIYVDKNKQDATPIGSSDLILIDGASSTTGTSLVDYDSNATSPLNTNVIFSEIRKAGAQKRTQFYEVASYSSDWDSGHFVMGAYHFWVSQTAPNAGKLMIKNGAPTSDNDGTVVGSQ